MVKCEGLIGGRDWEGYQEIQLKKIVGNRWLREECPNSQQNSKVVAKKFYRIQSQLLENSR